jgi:hypothetical protein
LPGARVWSASTGNVATITIETREEAAVNALPDGGNRGAIGAVAAKRDTTYLDC